MYDLSDANRCEQAGLGGPLLSLLSLDLAPYMGLPGSVPIEVPAPTHLPLIEVSRRLGLDGWLFELFRYAMARRLCQRSGAQLATLAEFGAFHHLDEGTVWGLTAALTETEAWRASWLTLSGGGPLATRTMVWNPVVELALIGALPAGIDVLPVMAHLEPSWWFGVDVAELQDALGVDGIVIEVVGPRRVGKTSFVVNTAQQLELSVYRPALFVRESLQTAAQYATLTGNVLLLSPRNDEELQLAEQTATLHRDTRVVIERLAADDNDPLAHRLPVSEVRLSLTLGSRGERRTQWTRLWRGILEPGEAAELGSRHSVPVGELLALRASTLRGGKRSGAAVIASLRSVAQHALNGLAVREESEHQWDELIVSERTREQLDGIVRRYQCEQAVVQAFPSAARQLKRKCTAMFSGPPGTGKTMAARLLASRLGLPCFRVDLASVVSKYIGETEKKLREIFEQCRKADVVVLFDEADSLFSKRTSVRTSNDRYANLEVNYLLQSLERFEGVAILTTNHPQSIDEAFERRLEFLIHFDFPSPSERRRLWEVTLPKEVLSSAAIDLQDLAERFELSGALIRKCVERALFKAVADGTRLDTTLLAAAAAAELGETGCLVRHAAANDEE